MTLRWISLTLILLLVAGCGSRPVYAPVGARDNVQKPAAATTTQAKTAPANSRRAPVGKPPVRNKSAYHVVQRGETLYSIAWKYGLSYRELAAINHIRSPYTIYAGQRLHTSSSTRQTGSARTRFRTTPVPTPTATAKARPEPVATTQPKTATTSPVAASTDAQSVVIAAKPLPGNVQKWVWPAKGKLLHSFQPNSAGKKGIDIGGNKGQSVMAAADGKVVYSGSGLVGYGRLIIIKHTENLLSAYGHNSELLVLEGQHVRAGQTIARMGNSGTDRTQLYFEIRKDGKPVDPLRYLPGV